MALAANEVVGQSFHAMAETVTNGPGTIGCKTKHTLPLFSLQLGSIEAVSYKQQAFIDAMDTCRKKAEEMATQKSNDGTLGRNWLFTTHQNSLNKAMTDWMGKARKIKGKAVYLILQLTKGIHITS